VLDLKDNGLRIPMLTVFVFVVMGVMLLAVLDVIGINILWGIPILAGLQLLFNIPGTVLHIRDGLRAEVGKDVA